MDEQTNQQADNRVKQPWWAAPIPRFACCVLAMLGAWEAHATETEEPLSGLIEVGIRSVDVTGDEYKYQQHVNLDDGPFIEQLSLRYEPKDSAERMPDLISVDPGRDRLFGRVADDGHIRLARWTARHHLGDLVHDNA